MKVSENLAISCCNHSLKSCRIIRIILIKNSSKGAFGVKTGADSNPHGGTVLSLVLSAYSCDCSVYCVFTGFALCGKSSRSGSSS